MTPEERLRQKDPAAFACFVRVRRIIKKRTEWRPEYAIGLAALAPACSFYLYTAREAQREDIDPAVRKEVRAFAEEQRQAVRATLVQFLVIDEALWQFGVLNPAGEDELIAALCAPLPHPIKTG